MTFLIYASSKIEEWLLVHIYFVSGSARVVGVSIAGELNWFFRSCNRSWREQEHAEGENGAVVPNKDSKTGEEEEEDLENLKWSDTRRRRCYRDFLLDVKSMMCLIEMSRKRLEEKLNLHGGLYVSISRWDLNTGWCRVYRREVSMLVAWES